MRASIFRVDSRLWPGLAVALALTLTGLRAAPRTSRRRTRPRRASPPCLPASTRRPAQARGGRDQGERCRVRALLRPARAARGPDPQRARRDGRGPRPGEVHQLPAASASSSSRSMRDEKPGSSARPPAGQVQRPPQAAGSRSTGPSSTRGELVAIDGSRRTPPPVGRTSSRLTWSGTPRGHAGGSSTTPSTSRRAEPVSSARWREPVIGPIRLEGRPLPDHEGS